MIDLSFVPLEELRKIRTSDEPKAKKAAKLAAACRINALYAIKKAGSGHIGSSFSSLDIVTWLHLFEKAEDDVYFSSKGHDVPGLYALMAALETMEFPKLGQLRRLGGLPGHPDVSIPGIAANTGSLGMGVSKAKGIVHAWRIQGKKGRKVTVLTGDGELQEGQLWESLAQAANLGMHEITAIVDANKIQSDLWVSRVSDLGEVVAKARAFGWHSERVDGHDFAALADLFARLDKITDKPKFIVADTVKGKGVSFMQGLKDGERLYQYHSGAPGDIEYGKAVEELSQSLPGVRLEKEARAGAAAPLSTGKMQNLVVTYSRELVAQAEKNPNLAVLDGDLVKDCGLLKFEEKFPERFIECGIAEQDMVSQAGAMARQGMLPVVHSFSCFLSARPNEQIYNNALEKDKVIYVGSLAGFLPAGPGTSHQAVRDISTLAAVPGMLLIEPCDAAELTQVFDYSVNKTPDATYLRLISVSCDIPYKLPEGYVFEPGKGATLHEGADAVLFGYGPILLTQAWHAAELLKARGIGLKVVNVPTLNRVDAQWLKSAVGDRSWVFTLDNHYVTGGVGERLLAALAETGPTTFNAKRFGLTRTPLCGTYDEVLKAHGLDAESLAREIEAAMGNRGGSGGTRELVSASVEEINA